MDLKYALIGFARGLGVVFLGSALVYLGNAENLSYLSPLAATIISSIALAIENAIESSTGRALFGAVKA